MALPPTHEIRMAMVRALADGSTLDTRTELEPRVAALLGLSAVDRRAASPNGTTVLLNTIDALTGTADRSFGYFEKVAPRHYRLSHNGRSAATATPNVREHLERLVGTTIQTISGRPNRVVSLQESTVIVATDHSPEGEAVPLADIQAAIDRVFGGEEVRVAPYSVGYRSAFIGAVLRSMQGVEVLQRPLRARLTKAPVQPELEWEFDELVLTLDQYLRTGDHVEPSNPDIVALSDLLGRLLIHERNVDRTPDAVIQMLRRWHEVDPAPAPAEYAQPTVGTSGEKAVWNRFVTTPAGSADDLDAAVATIKALADEDTGGLPPADGEAEATEGRLLFRLHRARERDPEIIRRKKAAVLDHGGRLACEVCDFDFAATYGPLGDGFIECHHRLPLATAGVRATTLADLALVIDNGNPPSYGVAGRRAR
jgi:5-methylcytosine-specific restriction protein A